jgi:hypothetical protein
MTLSIRKRDPEHQDGAISSVGILSLKPGGGTARMSGTSMAAPHVAGVVAILLQQAGGAIMPSDIRRKIMAGASNTSAPYASPTAGYTRSDANPSLWRPNGVRPSANQGRLATKSAQRRCASTAPCFLGAPGDWRYAALCVPKHDTLAKTVLKRS